MRSISDPKPAPNSATLESSGRTVLRAIMKVGLPAIALSAMFGLLVGPGLGAFGDGLVGGLWGATGLVLCAGLARVRQEEQRVGFRIVRSATLRPWADWREERGVRTWRFFTMPYTTKVDEMDPSNALAPR